MTEIQNPSLKCPICKENISLVHPITHSPFVLLHGIPLHAVILFSNPSGLIKAVEGCQSIEIMRNASTFSNLLSQFHRSMKEE